VIQKDRYNLWFRNTLSSARGTFIRTELQVKIQAARAQSVSKKTEIAAAPLVIEHPSQEPQSTYDVEQSIYATINEQDFCNEQSDYDNAILLK
jgi:hypothetical protein